MGRQLKIEFQTKVFEIHTIINKLQRRVTREGISPQHRKHAARTVAGCLKKWRNGR